MNEREFTTVIEQAVEEGWVELDLRGKEITALPSEAGQLTNLQQLDLRGNRLTKVSPAIDQLTHLRALDLRGNKLTELTIRNQAAVEVKKDAC